MDKKTLIAMGTGLALSLTSAAALASSDASMQAHEVNSSYSNSDNAKVGNGQCGANNASQQSNMKNTTCTKSQNCSDNASSKAGSGKCGSGKCGSGKCASGKCAGSDN